MLSETHSLLSRLARWLRALGQNFLLWSRGWWQVLFTGAQLVVLACSPSSYHEQGFTTLMALFNVVLIRIVVVTAFAYGLSQYALNMVVRVLVLELVPLVATLFVAINYSVPGGSELYKLRKSGALESMRRRGVSPLEREVLPRVLAGMFAVVMLAAVSCTISLILTYLAVHGFTLAGIPSYNRAVGHIFTPVVVLIFVLKTGLFAFAVALLPVGNALRDIPRRARASVELQGLVQMCALMLLIEIASLVGNYY